MSTNDWWEEHKRKELEEALKKGHWERHYWIRCPYCGKNQWRVTFPPYAEEWTEVSCEHCKKDYKLKWEYLFSTKTMESTAW